MSIKRILRKEILVNQDTGEEFSVVSIIPERRDDKFVKVYKTLSLKVIHDLKAGLDGAVETLFWLIDRLLEMENLNKNPEIYAHPQDIAKALGTSERTIQRHLKILKGLRYIHQVRPEQYVFQFDPNLVFYGTLRKYLDHESRKTCNACRKAMKTEKGEVNSQPNQDDPKSKKVSKKAGKTKRASDSKK